MAPFTSKYSPNKSRGKGLLGLVGRLFSGFRKRAFPTAGGKKTGVFPVGRKHDGRAFSRVHILLLVVPLLVAAGGWFIYGRLASSDIFRLTEVSVSGNHMVSRHQLIEKSGLRQGMNLLGFDVRGAQDRLRQFAWVEQADLHVAWPSRVEIRIRERHPLALVRLGGKEKGSLFYLDRTGYVFAPVLPGQDVDFPILTGDLNNLGLDKKQIRPDTPVAGALAFLQLAARGNAILPAQAVSELHVDAARGLIVYLVDRPFPIYMGWENIRTRYYRLVKILERLYRKKKINGIKEIQMNYMENRALVATVDPGR